MFVSVGVGLVLVVFLYIRLAGDVLGVWVMGLYVLVRLDTGLRHGLCFVSNRGGKDEPWF